MIDIQNLQKSHPKAWKSLKEWCIEGLKKQRDAYLNGLSKEQREGLEIPEIEDVQDNEVGAMVQVYQRRLYDFFGDNNMEVSIWWSDEYNWSYMFAKDEWLKDGYKTRGQAEEACLLEGFKILEKGL